MGKTIVIMPGGFHPFHAGHLALYQSAQRAFPDAEVYVAATNDTSTRPFPFPVKEKLAKLAGVESGHFVQVKSPFRAEEITSKFNPEQDQLIFVRSEKDANKPPQAGGVKRDGAASYLQPLLGAKRLEPFSKHAYMAYLPTVEFGPGMTSATEIRTAWPTLDQRRKTALVMSLYPRTQGNAKLAATVVGLLDVAIGGEQSVAEAREKFNQSIMRPGFEFSQEIDGVTYEVTNDEGLGPVVTVTDKNNKVIAQAAFLKHKTRPGLESLNTYVEPAWQSQGIATTMYAVMRLLGANISPSTNQTDDGRDMWDKWEKYGDAKHIKSLNSKIKQQGMAESSLQDRLKKYVRPVVKTTPKIERITNPAGRTTDHVEWKVTGPMGDVNRFSSKKAAQAHYDSFGQPDVAETVSANATTANTAGAGAGLSATYQRRDNQPVSEDYLDERRL